MANESEKPEDPQAEMPEIDAGQIEPASEEDLNALNEEIGEAMKAADAEGTADGSNQVSIEGLQAELAEAEKRVLMAHADLENFRRRNRREMADQLRYAPLKLMSDILESVDNLQRAIESYEQDPNGDGLVEGVKMVSQQIATVLQNHGCKKIESVGQPFDPNLHQALQMQPSEEFAENTVMMDLRSGYQLHERVIRPSQVFVSTGTP